MGISDPPLAVFRDHPHTYQLLRRQIISPAQINWTKNIVELIKFDYELLIFKIPLAQGSAYLMHDRMKNQMRRFHLKVIAR
jgi:hypothetical protein